MRSALFILLFSIIGSGSFSQSLIQIASVRLEKVNQVSVDQSGKIYLATFDGDIVRFNPHLNNKETFSPPNPATTQILDAWQGLRIFTFHRDLQLYRLINRNLSLHEDYQFPPDRVGFVELSTSSFDNNIWLIDQTDFSLKKYNIRNKQIDVTTPLNQLLNPKNYELLHCQEYQNRLFISTQNVGILIFDNFGNFIKTFEFIGINHFGFWKDDLYFLSEDQLVKINLYNDQIEKLMPPEGDWEFVLIYDDLIYLLSKNELNLYQQKNPD